MNSKRFMVSLALLTFFSASSAFADVDPMAKFMSMMEDFQKQMTQMQKTIEQQNKTIEHQNEKIVNLEKTVMENGVPKTLPLPTPEPAKPKSLKEQARDYLLGQHASPPREDEKLPVKAGMGSVEIGTLLQEWYTFDDHAADNFRHRRLEFGLGGRLIEHLKWKLAIDPSEVREDNTQRSVLKDAYFAFDGIPHHEIKLGQYKIPVTEEGFRSSALIDTIERSFIGRTFGDKRDIGLMTEGKWKYLDYQAGVFNGDERNRFDSNDQKDLVARAVLKPFSDSSVLKGLELGSSIYWGATHTAAEKKKRFGLEARYEYGPLSLKSEFMTGQNTSTPLYGWYIQGGYFFLPRWQTVVKFEGFDPNERKAGDKEYDTTIGLNYFLVKSKTKLQFNYIRKDVDTGQTPDNQIIAAAQYAF